MKVHANARGGGAGGGGPSGRGGGRSVGAITCGSTTGVTTGTSGAASNAGAGARGTIGMTRGLSGVTAGDCTSSFAGPEFVAGIISSTCDDQHLLITQLTSYGRIFHYVRTYCAGRNVNSWKT